MRQYYVYMMTNKFNRVLYVGVTNDLERRVWEHKEKLIDGFTSRYNITKLVYYEVGCDILSTIQREKQIKGWVRRRKVALIKSLNPTWQDLSEDFI
ncbi:GIY-YIG nuclease family protein [Patescibacteria group bacterium]|nr:GIY-YIG nuclease family protein [Patescibacteria group bacterium]